MDNQIDTHGHRLHGHMDTPLRGVHVSMTKAKPVDGFTSPFQNAIRGAVEHHPGAVEPMRQTAVSVKPVTAM